MPDYLERTGRDTTDDILIRVPESEKKVSRLSGPASKRLGIDRGSIPSVAAPLEGQMMIQYADEAVGSTPVSPDVGATFLGEKTYYYSNTKWRPFTAGFTLNSAEEHLYVSSTTVAAISSVQLNWSHWDGATLLDLTAPGQPVTSTGGIYGVGASVQITPSGTPAIGDGVDIALLAVQSIGFPPSTPSPSRATYVYPGTSDPGVWYGEAHIPVAIMGATDSFELHVVNFNSYDVTVVAGIRVVLIVAL